MVKQKKAYLYAILSVLFWSTVASAFKISLKYLGFLQLLFYSSLTSIIVLFLVLLTQKNLHLLKTFTLKDYLKSLALGFLNPFLYYTVLFKAYSILTAQEALVLNYVWPITLVVLSIPLLKQRIRIHSIMAILISFTGVFIIATRGNVRELRLTNSSGVILALGSTVIWSLFWLFNVRDKREEVAKLFLNFISGFIFILIATLFFSSIHVSYKPGLLGAIYVGIFEMGITFVLWLKALKLSNNTARVANLIYLTPFFSLVCIRIVVGEHIFASTLLGLIFIITGIIVQNYSDFFSVLISKNDFRQFCNKNSKKTTNLSKKFRK